MKFSTLILLSATICIFAACSPKAGSAIDGTTGSSSSAQSTTGNNSPAPAKKSFAPKNPGHDSQYNHSLQQRK